MTFYISGPTVSSTPLSEARSYANLAAANAYWDIIPQPHPSPSPSSSYPVPLHPRILCEERALDSYQNILFSMATFWRCAAAAPRRRWPSRLTVVSHAFKRRRLVEAHCAAVGFPPAHVRFVGINPPGVPEVLGAEERAVEEWVRDPHGRSEGLRAKRAGRNPWAVVQTLFLDERERKESGVETELLDGGKEEVLVDGGSRPWGRRED